MVQVVQMLFKGNGCFNVLVCDFKLTCHLTQAVSSSGHSTLQSMSEPLLSTEMY